MIIVVVCDLLNTDLRRGSQLVVLVKLIVLKARGIRDTDCRARIVATIAEDNVSCCDVVLLLQDVELSESVLRRGPTKKIERVHRDTKHAIKDSSKDTQQHREVHVLFWRGGGGLYTY